MLFSRQNALIWSLILVLLCLFPVVPSVAQEKDDHSSIAVILSRKIKPYLEALEGVEIFFNDNDLVELDTVHLPDYPEDERKELTGRLLSGRYDLVLTIGPESARYIHNSAVNDAALAVLHTMILNPENIVGQESCTIPLNIPLSTQLSRIKTYLPEVGRLGLIFDPQLNREFSREASRLAADLDLKIVELKVADRKSIPGVLRKSWPAIDALWFIPDKTVISSSIVRYIIKEALVNRTPVIGYNRFFVQSGAAMSFIFDYKEIGRQSAALSQTVLAGNRCRSQPPRFKVKINEKVVERLKLRVE